MTPLWASLPPVSSWLQRARQWTPQSGQLLASAKTKIVLELGSPLLLQKARLGRMSLKIAQAHILRLLMDQGHHYVKARSLSAQTLAIRNGPGGGIERSRRSRALQRDFSLTQLLQCKAQPRHLTRTLDPFIPQLRPPASNRSAGVILCSNWTPSLHEAMVLLLQCSRLVLQTPARSLLIQQSPLQALPYITRSPFPVSRPPCTTRLDRSRRLPIVLIVSPALYRGQRPSLLFQT